MKRDNKIRDELENLSPFLSKMKEQKKGDGFQVSPTFFKDLTGDIMAKVQEPEPIKPNPIIVFLQQLLRPRYALTFASLAIIIIASVSILNPSVEQPEDLLAKMSIEDFDPIEIEAYEDEVLASFDLDELSEEDLASIDFDQIASAEEDDFWKDVNPDIFTEEVLEEYLNEILEETTLEELL